MTDDPSLVRDMALAGCTGVFIGFESLHDDNLDRRPQEEPAARRTMPAGSRSCIDNGIQVNGSFVLGFDHDRPGCLRADGRVDRGKSAGVRDLSHPDALPGHAAVSPDGSGGPAAAPGLVACTTRGTSSFGRST